MSLEMKIGKFEIFCFEAKASDVYSLGLILFEMIKFNRPFGENDSIYDRQHLNRQLNLDYGYKPEINQNISETVKDLINKLLEPNPQKRITAKKVLSHRWLQ
jgi:calcium-dependent protein kinase